MVGTSSGLGGFMSGVSIRFSKLKQGTGGADAWRDSLTHNFQRSADKRPRTTGTKLPKLHSIHSGTVVSMQAFGAFVQLGDGDTYKDGLLHVSALGAARFESPEEAGLSQGMKLWVKVSEVKEHDLKYSLDIRYVSQRDGTDLDPYQTKGHLPENFFEGGKVKPLLKVLAQGIQAQHALSEPADVSSPRRKRKRDAKEAETTSSDDSEERAKVIRKLEKARKKAEKAKKKAAKARNKLEKKAKKGKKAAKAEASSSDASPASDSA